MNSEISQPNSDVEEQEACEPESENVVIKTKKGRGRCSKEVKPLNEIEIKQRRDALEIARNKKKSYSTKEQELKSKEEELKIREKILQEEREKAKSEPPQKDVPKPEPKPKKKVQRVVEVSESDSEEEEVVYVKKPKQKAGIAQADYIDMVKKSNAEMLRKQLENERIRLAMMSCFPNMKF